MSQHWMETFDGERLRTVRLQRQFSQLQLAERLCDLEAGNGTPNDPRRLARRIDDMRKNIVLYEGGKQKPRAMRLRRIAQVLDVDVLDLLDPHTPRTLALLRNRLGISQAAAAAELGLDRAGYAHVEQGRRRLRADEAPRLARLLGVERTALPMPPYLARDRPPAPGAAPPPSGR